MKINIYDKWVFNPDGRKRSFRLSSTSKLRLNTKKHSPVKILARLSKIAKVSQYSDERSAEGRSLVVLVDKDYENALSGSAEQIHKFVRDCLSDAGLMSASWGRAK